MRRYASRKQADAVESLAILKCIRLRQEKARPKTRKLYTPSRWPKSGPGFWRSYAPPPVKTNVAARNYLKRRILYPIN